MHFKGEGRNTVHIYRSLTTITQAGHLSLIRKVYGPIALPFYFIKDLIGGALTPAPTVHPKRGGCLATKKHRPR